jgi:cyanophycin synthetase
MPTNDAFFSPEASPLRATDIRLVRGANAFAWSPLVRLRLDLGEYDEVFTNEIDGFLERLQAALPSLYDHHCSIGAPGGFFQRVREGTLLGHVLEHVALELQTLAGMDVTYGKTRSTSQKGVYLVVFSYIYEEAGMYAATAALDIVNSILIGRQPQTERIVSELRAIAARSAPSRDMQSIVEEARRRRIPVFRLDEHSPDDIQLGSGKYAQRFIGGVHIPRDLAQFQSSANANQTIAHQAEREVRILTEAARALSLPLRVFSSATQPESEFLAGRNSYRVLCIGGAARYALKLAPPVVAADGVSTVAALVQALNAARRSSGRLREIPLESEHCRATLERQGYAPDSVPPAGVSIALAAEGLPEYGGATIDMTDEISSENLALLNAIAAFLHKNYAVVALELRICAPSLRASLAENSENGEPRALAAISLRPDARLFQFPTSGRGFHVARATLEALFPETQTTTADDGKRIPVIAITAGVGADLLAAMTEDMLAAFGYAVGRATRTELFVRKQRYAGATHLPYLSHLRSGALKAMTCPDIDCAVVEVSLEDITLEGLGYDRADVGVVLNLTDEETARQTDAALEDMRDVAHAHALAAEFLTSSGAAALNANNPTIPRSVNLKDNESVLFGVGRDNPRIALHCSRGGRALTLDNDEIILREGKRESLFLRGASALETALDKDLFLALIASMLAFGIPVKRLRRQMEDVMGKINVARQEREYDPEVF